MAERYKIYEQLGAGGVGTVSRAYDNELKRWVAIKRLITSKDLAGDEKLITDLRREADALASLRNPNIVTVFDVASDADGLFMVLELLEGEDLADVVTRGPLHYDDFKELASQTLEGLLAAHQRHILHRDIKPENIKVERLPGGRMQSKIIDFGLARAGLRARKQTEDQSGSVMGSIHYMAPEQMTRQPVDERTDLYSLGCVFYEALSGRKAFDGDTVVAVMDKHINHDLVPLHVIAPHVPPWLGAWVMRLMACKPEDRPAHAQQAIEEFRAWEKMSSAPQMMPWMPMSYAPMPGQYAPPMYPTGSVPPVSAATTSSVPVQPVYYQTGQVPAYQTAQVPTYAEGPVLQPVIEVAAQTANIHTASPASPRQASQRGQPHRRPSQTPSQPAPKKSGLDPQIKTYALIGIAALVALVIGMSLLGGGSKKSTEQAEATVTAPQSADGTEKILFQLPSDRQFPPQDDDLVLHFVANTGQVKNTKDTSGRPHPANNNEPVFAWHDLAPRAQNNLMRAFQETAKYAPLRQPWNHMHIKSGRVAFSFLPRQDTPSALLLSDPGKDAALFPFGSSTVKGQRGLTFNIVFQADPDSLPTRVMTLSSPSGSSVSLSVTTDKHLLAEFVSDNGARSNITSTSVDGTKPVTAALTWSANSGDTAMRVRDGADKSFNGKGTSLTEPKQPLTRLQLGRVADAKFVMVDKAERFTGWLAEVEMYASVLRPDQLQLLEGPNIKSYYFNNIPPLTLRLKTKLPQIEPRTAWKFKTSQTNADAKNVADGSVTSRWGTKARQAPGQWFQVELPNEEDIAGLALDCQAASGDYPRKYHIELSSDGSEWTQVSQGEGKSALIEIIFTEPKRARFLRITQDSTTSTNDWAIYEMAIFKK
jgi:serine/threonine protein kinase